MKLKTFALALGVVSAGAFLLPDGVLARGGGRAGGFHAGGLHGANFHGANINRGNIARGNIARGDINRGDIGNRVGDWRGNVGYGGWGAAGAAATAVGAAAAGATLYNRASCYQQQQVWNGYTYVLQTVNVC